MSVSAVADTHTALWYLYGDPRLSATARAFIDRAAESGTQIAVSSISLIEVVYLVEKRRVAASAYSDLASILADPERVFLEVSVSKQVADALRMIPRLDIPDMPDRIIAATGLYFGVPILSCDRRIRAANLTTLW